MLSEHADVSWVTHLEPPRSLDGVSARKGRPGPVVTQGASQVSSALVRGRNHRAKNGSYARIPSLRSA